MSYKIIQGDCIEGMRQIADESVHCVVTSPPYYGLRDYGTAAWEGGDVNCDHIQSLNQHGGQRADRNQEGYKKLYKDICGKCGATRVDKQIGLEETPEAYVEKMVNVFREVRRILRSDGTVWLNLGDSYAGNGISQPQRDVSGGFSGRDKGTRGNQGYSKASGAGIEKKIPENLKPKDLIGIPWRVAFALQADGWWLRQDIIWHKPNPMPESVTDRCTKSHEYIFLLTKSERYFYDAEAIKEPFADARMGNPNGGGQYSIGSKRHDSGALKTGKWNEDGLATGRNKRSVWTVATQPYAEAHFAVYPPKLIEPCILAGSPVGGVVFDPFTGSGTTAYVALTNGRSYIGTELNPAYIEIAERRLSAIQPRMELS